jgi:hypothetical protein
MWGTAVHLRVCVIHAARNDWQVGTEGADGIWRSDGHALALGKGGTVAPTLSDYDFLLASFIATSGSVLRVITADEFANFSTSLQLCISSVDYYAHRAVPYRCSPSLLLFRALLCFLLPF